MIEEEHINVSVHRDRNNKKYPYLTSKYLCDVCHLRDTDLDNMKEMSNDPTRHEELKYYMIKKFVDFGGVSNRSTTVSMTPKEYCERPINDTHDNFNPCSWEHPIIPKVVHV